MASYKTLENLMKAFPTATEKTYEEIINNENASPRTDKERLAVLVFAEMQKALNNKSRKLVLDCNYPKSKFHNRTAKQIANGLADEWLVNYYRLIDTVNSGVPMIHIWPHCDVAKGNCTFELHITADVAPILEAHKDEFHFTVKRRKNGVIRDVLRTGVGYAELVDVVNSLCALLSTNAEQKAAEKAAKEEAKAEAKAEAKKSKKAPKTAEPKTEEEEVA